MSAIQPAQNRVLRKASPSRLKQMARLTLTLTCCEGVEQCGAGLGVHLVRVGVGSGLGLGSVLGLGMGQGWGGGSGWG